MRMKRISFVLSGVIMAFLASVGINATTVPYNMYVDPGTHYCLVTWEDDDNSAWNLRYRPYSEEPEVELLGSIDGTAYTNQSYQAVTLTAPWSGNNVYGGYGAIYFRNASHQSATTDGYIKFTIAGDYQDVPFTVKLTTANTDYGSGRFVVGSTQTATVQYSMSAGETHSWLVTGSTGDVITITSPEDKYSPDIATVEVYVGDATGAKPRASEWTYVRNLTKMEYTIEDLEAETDYEVQVQAICDNGTESDWTRPDVFTTLAEGEEPLIPVVHILGEVDDQAWSPFVGTKMEYDPENEIYTATVHVEAGRSFGFTTQIDDNEDMGGWEYIWPYRFGPESDGEFYLRDEVLGQQLVLTQDNFSDVYALKSGVYEVTVSLEGHYIIIGRASLDVIIGDVNKDGDVNIADVTTLISAVLRGVAEVETDHYDPAAANMNGDDDINIADVTILISYVLKPTNN